MKKNKILIEQVRGGRLKHKIKIIIAAVLNIFYHVIVFFLHPKNIGKKYKVSICCIFKNEEKYMKEWLEFHLLIGVEHFYLYNNFSDDNYMDVLAPYISRGIITLTDWPVKHGQMSAYRHWHDTHKNETSWVSFLDFDEFICPYYEKNIYSWVTKFKNYPSVVIYWKMFGTSGMLASDPDKLVTEQYTISWDRFHFFGKVLYNTSYEIAEYDSNMHHLTKCKIKMLNLSLNIPSINEFKRFVILKIHNFGFHKQEDFTIQVNHYWSKSYEEFLFKQNKGYVFSEIDPNNYEFFLNYEMRNKISDHKIFRFLLELKFAVMNKK